MDELRDPNDMTLDELKLELRERGHVVKGNPKKSTLVDRLIHARAGEAVGDDDDEIEALYDSANPDKPAAEDEKKSPQAPAAVAVAARTTFIKTVPVRNYVLVLEPAKYIRDADGHTIDKTAGYRVRFDKDGRFATDDPALVERIKKSRYFMSNDARVRIEIWDPVAKANELRAAAAVLDGKA